MLDTKKEMAWVTFQNDGFETKWFPVTSIIGVQLEWTDSNEIMKLCREQFNNIRGNGWTYFGIAPTSQMMLNNSVKDNF
tara:strand:+ start:1885 stop:2121 length:237 start_codon:yes stop_codon:yes gene_type:complete